MTDALQTIALTCGFLPAVVILWMRVSRLMRETEELHRQYIVDALADGIRRHRHNFYSVEAGRDHDAVN